MRVAVYGCNIILHMTWDSSMLRKSLNVLLNRLWGEVWSVACDHTAAGKSSRIVLSRIRTGIVNIMYRVSLKSHAPPPPYLLKKQIMSFLASIICPNQGRLIFVACTIFPKKVKVGGKVGLKNQNYKPQSNGTLLWRYRSNKKNSRNLTDRAQPR